MPCDVVVWNPHAAASPPVRVRVRVRVSNPNPNPNPNPKTSPNPNPNPNPNPSPNQDLPPPAYRHFVCVEPGLVAAQHALPAGGQALIGQKIVPAG